jgi:histidinol-phosphate aminotransferase
MNIPERLWALEPFAVPYPEVSVRMEANESFIAVPQAVREKIISRIAGMDLFRYPDPHCERLCALYAARVGIRPECLTVGNGSDELIGMAIGRLLPDGGTLLAPKMDFGSYRAYADIFGKRLCEIPRDAQMRCSADDLIRGAQENRPDLVIFSNPSSPCGAVMPRTQVERVIRSLSCLVAVDEAYMDFSDQTVIDLVEDCENLIVLRTFSKAYGMAAVRLGFAAANPRLTRLLRAVRDPYNINTLTQIAGEAVFEAPDYLPQAVVEIKRTTAILEEGLFALARKTPILEKVYPTQTNYVLVRVQDPEALQVGMAGQDIAVRRLSGPFVRISASSERNVRRFLDALAAFSGVSKEDRV